MIHANTRHDVDIVVIGAGIAGIATAYYLSVEQKQRSVLLIDYRQPMSYTSAQSGDNYRNWWPHPTMTAFTNDSIDLMQRLADGTENVFNMTQRGYVLATRETDTKSLMAGLRSDLDVDVVSGRSHIQQRFPALSTDIQNVLHIKRAGDISGQQLGTLMLARFKEAGGRRLQGEVTAIRGGRPYSLYAETNGQALTVSARAIVNAAGPFVADVARMLDTDLPVTNIYQQKISFDDRLGAIPRDMPFSIDLDEKLLDWSDEERQLLAEDPTLAWVTERLPPGTHCRPDGGQHGSWVKLGWAYNKKESTPERELANEAASDPQFPEIVIRGAAAFLPSLKAYIDEPPSRFVHYGGYYTMTKENWPLIGPMGPEDTYVVGALSGFGSMAACAAGQLGAAWVCEGALPAYAEQLSLERYADTTLIARLQNESNKGVL
ncbi:MAG: NAD(P)/FAD-dependent oxidoreductase [Woeseiaceae bacterium]